MTEYFTIGKKDGVVVVKFLFSELSLKEADEIKQELYELISGHDRKFIISMEKCAFLSSSVLGMVVQVAAKVHEKSGRIVLCNMSEAVRALFKITRLERIFNIYNSEEEAVRSFSNDRPEPEEDKDGD